MKEWKNEGKKKVNKKGKKKEIRKKEFKKKMNIVLFIEYYIKISYHWLFEIRLSGNIKGRFNHFSFWTVTNCFCLPDFLIMEHSILFMFELIFFSLPFRLFKWNIQIHWDYVSTFPWHSISRSTNGSWLVDRVADFT